MDRVTCHKCGAEQSYAHNFCSDCGANLQALRALRALSKTLEHPRKEFELLEIHPDFDLVAFVKGFLKVDDNMPNLRVIGLSRANTMTSFANLSTDQFQVLIRRYGLDGGNKRSYKKIASEINVGPNAIRRLERSALAYLIHHQNVHYVRVGIKLTTDEQKALARHAFTPKMEGLCTLEEETGVFLVQRPFYLDLKYIYDFLMSEPTPAA